MIIVDRNELVSKISKAIGEAKTTRPEAFAEIAMREVEKALDLKPYKG